MRETYGTIPVWYMFRVQTYYNRFHTKGTQQKSFYNDYVLGMLVHASIMPLSPRSLTQLVPPTLLMQGVCFK